MRHFTNGSNEVGQDLYSIQIFYQDLYSQSQQAVDLDAHLIGADILILTSQQQDHLMRPLTVMEIEEALSSITSDSVASPDGLTARFFKHSWSVVKTDHWITMIMQCVDLH